MNIFRYVARKLRPLKADAVERCIRHAVRRVERDDARFGRLRSRIARGTARRSVVYDVENTPEAVFGVVERFTNLPVVRSLQPRLHDLHVILGDERHITSTGPGWDCWRRAIGAASKCGLLYVKLRLEDTGTTDYGFVSFVQDNRSGTLEVHFKEYERLLDNAFVSTCLHMFRDMGLRLCKTDEDAEPAEVLAACVDLRGFSAFCSHPDVESIYVGRFLAEFDLIVRNSIVDTLESMNKPLGDGRFLVWDAAQVDLNDVVHTVLARVREMSGHLRALQRDPRFNVPVPMEMGCGVARGAVVRVGADYVGRPMNLAARLCGSARPNGMVLDAAAAPKFSPLGWDKKLVEVQGFEAREVWICRFGEGTG